MNGRHRFATLLEMANREAPPPIDISDRVASSVERLVQSRSRNDVPWGLTGFSVAAAVAVLVFVARQGVWFDDPLVDWLRSLPLVMQ